MTSYNLSELFELVADAVPDREVVVASERRLRYAQLDERATRLANALRGRGIGPGDHVGLELSNGSEYAEGMLAAYKLRAVPINVNYRYVEAELRQLFDDAELRALVVHRRFAPRVAEVAAGLPKLRTFLVVEDGSAAPASLPGAGAYEEALATASPKRDFPGRCSDDLYIVYTGGTTGLPKGVLWRHEDIFFAAMGGGDPMRAGRPIESPDEIVSRITTRPMVALATPPYVHAAAQWLLWSQLTTGGTLVTTRAGAFDPAEIWTLVDREGVQMLLIVGDAMATPLADELAAHRDRYAAASLFAIASGGALFSPATKSRLLQLLPGRLVLDGLGASETGALGTEAPGAAGNAAARFRVGPDTTVLDESLRPLAPGSGAVGRLARRGHIPLGYWRDPAKSRAVFVEADGVRWALPGDLATIEADGTIRLLGRGSTSINTGGEKVFPEEVESALKEHPAIADAVVVGVPDARFGERVVALVQARRGSTLDAEEVREFCRARIAGFKVPRAIVSVREVARSPAGKADYRWARETALQAALTSPRRGA